MAGVGVLCEPGPSLPPGASPRISRAGGSAWYACPAGRGSRGPRLRGRAGGQAGRSGKLRHAPARRGPEKVPGHPNHTFHLHHPQRVKSIYRWRGSAGHASRGRPSLPVPGEEVRAGRPGEPRPVFTRGGVSAEAGDVARARRPGRPRPPRLLGDGVLSEAGNVARAGRLGRPQPAFARGIRPRALQECLPGSRVPAGGLADGVAQRLPGRGSASVPPAWSQANNGRAGMQAGYALPTGAPAPPPKG